MWVKTSAIRARHGRRARPVTSLGATLDLSKADAAAGSDIQVGVPWQITLGAGGSGLVECLSVRP